MRPNTYVRAAAGTAAATLLLVGASACANGSGAGSASPTPDIPAATSSSTTTATTAPTAPAANPAAGPVSVDANALLAAQHQLTGCKAALTPVFDAFRNGTWGTNQTMALAATPAAARPAMQQTIDYYKQILSSDASANTDGQGTKAVKYLEAFCATPDGAKLVGATPVDALRPVKVPRSSTKR